MIRLTAAELFKLRTMRLYWGLLVAASLLVVVVTALHFLLAGDARLSIEGASDAVNTAADLRSVLDVSGVAGLFTLVLGATAVSGEYRHRTIATTFLLTPNRSKVLFAKVGGYVIAGVAFGLVVEAAAAAVAVGWLVATGAEVPLGSTVVVGLALTPVATGLAAGFGVGVGAAIPNQLASVLAAVGWVMVIEQVISGLVPDLVRWLPFAGAGPAITGQNPELGPVAGLGVFFVYLALVVAGGLWVVEHRDVA